ncbi:hypothetical protein BV898_16142 [Hypsibius exemplaris]|uniref:Uncharacterized protein n=1 Tax=Hypsibius exemplaris TaxID=2072580 RepID=A0A9X6RLE5_HYPEX|nr:hypothetical protein BV898_16142 [Hypsibius exemplaris]
MADGLAEELGTSLTLSEESGAEETTSSVHAAPSPPSPPPPPPPMPSSLSGPAPPTLRSPSVVTASNGGGISTASGLPPPPPPPPGLGVAAPTYKQQKEQSFQEQQMANLPSGLMTTAMKADKKPFSYTPIGLSATDLKSPSVIRQEKLDAASVGDSTFGGSIVPGIPRGPAHYRVFNGITPPSPTFGGSASSEANTGSSSYSPSLRRSNSAANSVTSGDEQEGVRAARPSGNTAGTGAPIQSRSFRILQWMTGADEDDDVSSQPPPSTAEPDEMRFRGYNQPAAIPSRAFQTLDRMTSSSSPQPQHQHSLYGRPPSPSPYARSQQPATPDPEPFRTDLTEEQAANLRYGGSGNPSRSFKMLQDMTDNETVLANTYNNGYARQRSPVQNFNPQNGSLLLQNLYVKAPSHHAIPPPSPLDFKYQGPSYSTYELPNPRTPAANSVATPKYSTSMNFTPTNNNGSQFNYGAPSPAYSSGSPYGQQSSTRQQPPSSPSPAYYSGTPSRNFQYSQVSTGQNGGYGVSDF